MLQALDGSVGIFSYRYSKLTSHAVPSSSRDYDKLMAEESLEQKSLNTPIDNNDMGFLVGHLLAYFGPLNSLFLFFDRLLSVCPTELGERGKFLVERNVVSLVTGLSLLNCYIWNVLQERAQGTLHPIMESLEAHIAEAWVTLVEALIARACRSFRSRVEAVISANGSYIA